MKGKQKSKHYIKAFQIGKADCEAYKKRNPNRGLPFYSMLGFASQRALDHIKGYNNGYYSAYKEREIKKKEKAELINITNGKQKLDSQLTKSEIEMAKKELRKDKDVDSQFLKSEIETRKKELQTLENWLSEKGDLEL